MNIKIYPKVFKSFKTQKLYVELENTCESISIRIMPMEKYGIPHKDFRIDENYRYSFEDMTKEGDKLYSYEYKFSGEQRYSVSVLVDGEKIYKHLYAVDEDLAGLQAFKGDTHLHSCRSDGTGTPFEVAVAYRKRAYDFIALTDHHKYAPSLEARDAVSASTDYFTVFPGEEVHNKDMGYFHMLGEVLRNNRISQWIMGKEHVKTDTYWIKRVVAVPGDTVSFKDGQFYRNGEAVEENYILEQTITKYPDEEIVVPEGCVFVMGDNRNESMDSRMLAMHGEQIAIDHIVGKLISK
jgi:signal peptidase I